jgi:hypothetical protein
MMELRVVSGVKAPEDRYEWAKRAADFAKLKANKARAKLIKHVEQHGCQKLAKTQF